MLPDVSDIQSTGDLVVSRDDTIVEAGVRDGPGRNSLTDNPDAHLAVAQVTASNILDE